MPTDSPMLYYAYGSNMDWAQMQRRCPDARFRAIGVLDGHRLCFPRRSNLRGCGVASIQPVAGESVWGVVYAVSAADLAALDGHEGYEEGREKHLNRYNRVEIQVSHAGDTAQRIVAWTYVAVIEESPPLPSLAYMAHLMAGAATWGLPADYRARLQAVATT